MDTGDCTPPKYTFSTSGSSYYGDSQFDDYLVINMDWNQSKAYCEWRGASLPTEAQWEKAARGADGRTYPWGEGIDYDKANYWDKDNGCIGHTTKVGSYESGKSPYGIYDMADNVWEWAADWYSDTYYQNSPSENPLGPDSGQYHVLRGGAWGLGDGLGYLARSSLRSWGDYDYSGNLGFRCARSAAAL